MEASPTLESGRYTAIATQPSSLGNTAGKSEPVTFKVDTEAPTVTLNQPPSPSNDTTPSFTGTAEDTTPITVYIYAGATATGSPVSTATAEGTGERWSSGSASQALPNGQYTAKATQGSAGHEGTSSSVTFTVDTTPPLVALTFPSSGSTTSGGTQLVKGGAGTAPGDRSVVTIRLFAGSTIEAQQIPLETHLAEASNGGWSDNLGGLNPGTYTVQASQSDEAGNVGVSAATFTVVAPPFTPPTSPAASFRWFPSAPQTGEPVSLVSSSTDAASPITAFAWAPTSSSPFQAGGGVLTTSFSTPGGHVVRLRVTNAAGLSSVATETINVVGTRTPLIQPFPVVRIAGTEAASGVKLRLLAVQAPTGARITVKCRGRGCPVKSASRVARSGKVGVAPVEFRRFERTLRAGVILDVRVSKPGAIGKYTHFVVRRGKLPERLDMCLDPAGVAPLVCPSS